MEPELKVVSWPANFHDTAADLFEQAVRAQLRLDFAQRVLQLAQARFPSSPPDRSVAHTQVDNLIRDLINQVGAARAIRDNAIQILDRRHPYMDGDTRIVWEDIVGRAAEKLQPTPVYVPGFELLKIATTGADAARDLR